MSGFGALSAHYDGFIVDLWGVVHDGVKPYPGVLDCLARLKAAGKRVVFLSNAPRRAAIIGEALHEMGITEAFYDGIMSSGEAVHVALRDRTDEFARTGRDACSISGRRVTGGFLTRFRSARRERRRRPISFSIPGPDDILGPQDPSVYQPFLDEGLRTNKPMVCANPDLEVIRDGQRIICAGLLAEIYRVRGRQGDPARQARPGDLCARPWRCSARSGSGPWRSAIRCARTSPARKRRESIRAGCSRASTHCVPRRRRKRRKWPGSSHGSILPGFGW